MYQCCHSVTQPAARGSSKVGFIRVRDIGMVWAWGIRHTAQRYVRHLCGTQTSLRAPRTHPSTATHHHQHRFIPLTSPVGFLSWRGRQHPHNPYTGLLLGGGEWHKASELGCVPLAAPIGLSPLHILTLCGAERVLVVSMEPLDDLSWGLGWGGGDWWVGVSRGVGWVV